VGWLSGTLPFQSYISPAANSGIETWAWDSKHLPFTTQTMSGRYRKIHRESAAKDVDIPRHVCYVCQRPRSSSYHARHPLRPGDTPIQRVCSRCVKKGYSERIAPSPTITVYEVHHYHHTCSCRHELHSPRSDDVVELPTNVKTPDCVELPSEELRRPNRSFSFSHKFPEDRPPQVRTWTKPNVPSSLW
jgi:hypothetical protein